MELTIMGEITDKTINHHFLSKPKVTLYFNNGKEDRRIPFVLSNVTYLDGKCFFSGTYIYRLDLLFWKTQKDCLPFDMYINLGFADYYEENIKVDLNPEIFEMDNKCYECFVEGNRLSFLPDKMNIIHTPLTRCSVNFINFWLEIIEYIFAIIMLPLFFVDALLNLTGVKRFPNRFNDKSLLKRFFAFIFWRFSQVSTSRVTLWTAKRFIFRTCYNFYKLRKVKGNKVTFISVRYGELSGNFAFVYNKIKNNKKLDIRFILNEYTIAEMSFKEIMAFTKECATSRVIVLDEFTPQIHYIDMRPQTKLIQLWHACGAFKTFGFTRLSKPMGSAQTTFNHRNYDYVTVSSSYCRKCYAEGFGISTENVVATGIPRTDIFFDKEYGKNARKKFFDAYPQLAGKRIVLFAPTFRGAAREIAFYPTEMFDLDKICGELPDDYVFIVKHHPFVMDKQPIPNKYKNRIIDLSDSNELNDLLFVTDLVITDYSSLVFEASLLEIPMIFYAFDLEKYINERDFYFDFRLLVPGKVVYCQEELISSIKQEDYCTEKIKPFVDIFFDHRDGRSTERVVKLIEGLIE